MQAEKTGDTHEGETVQLLTHDRFKLRHSMFVTSERRQIVSSAAAAAESTGHGRVVKILIHFAAVLVILISLWLLRSEKQNARVTEH